MKKIIVNTFITVFIVLFFASCAKQEQVEEQTFIIPSPPDEPRFMHLVTLRGESDFKKKDDTSFLDNLIGDGSMMASRDFGKPYGIAISKGKLYVTDTAMGVVFVVDTINQKVSFIGDQNSGKLSLPVGVAVDNNENVYVTDSKLQRVFGYNKNGELIFVLGNNDEFIRPTGIAINRDAEILYVIDTKGHVVRAFSLNGDFLFDIGQRGKEDGEFNFPTNLAVDQKSGNVIVVDTQNFRIQIFDQDGNHIKTFGNIGDIPGTFARPKGVTVDSEGNIYVADSAFDNIQIFNSEGTQLLLYFGQAGVNPGQFNQPAGIAFDESDRLHVTENFSGKVQVFQYFSEQWKKLNKEEYSALLESRKLEVE